MLQSPREALQNAGKHAGDGATAVVKLAEEDRALVFEISYDGRGCAGADTADGAGLQNMRDRIGALGGELDVRSTEGAGTVVSGTVPLV